MKIETKITKDGRLTLRLNDKRSSYKEVCHNLKYFGKDSVIINGNSGVTFTFDSAEKNEFGDVKKVFFNDGEYVFAGDRFVLEYALKQIAFCSLEELDEKFKPCAEKTDFIPTADEKLEIKALVKLPSNSDVESVSDSFDTLETLEAKYHAAKSIAQTDYEKFFDIKRKYFSLVVKKIKELEEAVSSSRYKLISFNFNSFKEKYQILVNLRGKFVVVVEYDSPAQIINVVEMLKAAVDNGREFPNVLEYLPRNRKAPETSQRLIGF